jgi:integrase
MATKRSFGTVRKLPSGRYQVRYRRHGKQLSSGRTFATKADANAHLAALETDLARGAIFSPDVGKVRFGEDARRWLDERDIQPRTRETHESQLKWINDTFELAVLNEITPGDVRAWHGQLVRSRLHPNSVSKIYRMLRTIFTTAVDDGLIKVNPAHVKGASREATVERPLLEWDQVTALANAIEPRFSAMIWLAATSGLRFGELTALRPSDFDFERATVTVRHSLAFRRGSGPTVGSPKTSSAHRTVSVPAPVLAKVERHIESYIDDVYGATFVFTSMKGRPLLNRYAALFPEQAGRMVLDGAVDPSLSAIQQNLRQAGGFQLAFDDYLADCLANDCPLGSAADEVEAKVTELFATAAATPLPTGNPERPLTQTLAVYGIVAPLYAPDVWPVLTESLTAAFDGDGTLLLAAADQYTGRGPDEYSSNQAQAQTAITCLDAQIPGARLGAHRRRFSGCVAVVRSPVLWAQRGRL